MGDASEMILTSTLITDVESELVIKGYNTSTDDQTNIDINLVTSQNLTNILLSASGNSFINGGYIGIGISTPSVLVDVVGAIKAIDLQWIPSSYGTTYSLNSHNNLTTTKGDYETQLYTSLFQTTSESLSHFVLQSGYNNGTSLMIIKVGFHQIM